jgi:hypothetical protein
VTQAGYKPVAQTVPSTQPAGQVVGQIPQGNVDPASALTLLASSGRAG